MTPSAGERLNPQSPGHRILSKTERENGVFRLLISFALVLIAAAYIAMAVLPALPAFAVALPTALLYALAVWLCFGRALCTMPDGRAFLSMLLIAASVLLRCALLGFSKPQYGCAADEWLQTAGSYLGAGAIGATAGDLPATYSLFLYPIALLARGTPALGPVYARLAGVFFEILAAYSVKRLLALFRPRAWVPYAAFLSVLFLPSGAVNAVMLGNFTCAGAAAALGAVTLGLEKRSAPSMLLFAVAFALGAPAIALLSAAAALLMTKRLYARDLWLLPAVVFVLLTPALLCGRSAFSLLQSFFHDAGSAQRLPHIASLFTDVTAAATVGNLLAAAYASALLFYLCLRRDRISGSALLLAVLCLTLGLSALSMKRADCGYRIAELLALSYAWKERGGWKKFLPVALSLFICNAAALYGLSAPLIPLTVLLLFILAALAFCIKALVVSVENHLPSIRP